MLKIRFTSQLVHCHGCDTTNMAVDFTGYVITFQEFLEPTKEENASLGEFKLCERCIHCLNFDLSHARNTFIAQEQQRMQQQQTNNMQRRVVPAGILRQG